MLWRDVGENKTKHESPRNPRILYTAGNSYGSILYTLNIDSMEFMVTFGQQYKHDPHPKVKYAHPDGWLTIEAMDMFHARKKAFEELGAAWSFIYEKDEFNPSYFPLGELKRIECIMPQPSDYTKIAPTLEEDLPC